MLGVDKAPDKGGNSTDLEGFQSLLGMELLRGFWLVAVAGAIWAIVRDMPTLIGRGRNKLTLLVLCLKLQPDFDVLIPLHNYEWA
jgi:hypothetical protein